MSSPGSLPQSDNDNPLLLNRQGSSSRFSNLKQFVSFRRSQRPASAPSSNNNSSNMIQSLRSSLQSFRKKNNSQVNRSTKSVPTTAPSAFALEKQPTPSRSPDWPLDRLMVGDYASKVVTVQASAEQDFAFDICGTHQGPEHASRRLKERRTLVALRQQQWKLCRVRQYDFETDTYEVVWEDGTTCADVQFGTQLVVPTQEQSKQLEVRLLAVARKRRAEDDNNNQDSPDEADIEVEEEGSSSNLTQSSTVCEEDAVNDNETDNKKPPRPSLASSIGSMSESMLRLLLGNDGNSEVLENSVSRSGSFSGSTSRRKPHKEQQ